MNPSNVIVDGGNFRVIDKETIKLSKRVLDFNIPLSLNGNGGIPEYAEGGLDDFFEGLARTGYDPHPDELRTIKPILKYGLIKHYVVKNVRRGLNDPALLANLETSLSRLNIERGYE